MPVGRLNNGVWLCAAALALCGCASAGLREVVPQKLVEQAQVPGLDNIRIWGDGDPAGIERFLNTEKAAQQSEWTARIASAAPLHANILVISGGADDGAFGAGLLVGWGKTGKRPQFDLVTGISAGALIAPLIFVGAEFDNRLASVFTTHDSSELYEANVLAGLLGGSSLADSGPLAKMISSYVDADLMRKVAHERAKGRILIVGTTNIDAQRPVFWDMGRIAQSSDPSAIEIFRKVLLASASIPGVFPPVHISVKAAGKTYEELHVDGGATRQLFLSPGDFSFKAVDKALGRKIKRTLYIIRNGKIGPEWKATEETTLSLAKRSLETLTKNQGIGDLIRIHSKAARDKIDYNLIAIPNDFTAPRPGVFDLAYMRPLYAAGLAEGEGTINWLKSPPGVHGD